MSEQHDSKAVAIARAHVEAWSNRDFDGKIQTEQVVFYLAAG